MAIIRLSPLQSVSFLLILLLAAFDFGYLLSGTSDVHAAGINSVTQADRPQRLALELWQRRHLVTEFSVLKKYAEAHGLRIYLLGGSASSFAHYVQWDIDSGQSAQYFRRHRFDYAIENILDDLQDVDLAVSMTNGTAEEKKVLVGVQEFAVQLFPKRKVEVFGLKTAWTDNFGKERMHLVNNPDFINQHSDSHSTVLLELTDFNSNEGILLDLKNNDDGNLFLNQVSSNRIKFYFSNSHQSTSRAKSGQNPPIIAVVRFLIKAFRYGLEIDSESEAIIKRIIDEFSPKHLSVVYPLRWLETNVPKMLNFVVDIERAINFLEDSGLKSKLLTLRSADLHILLNKEPLRVHSHPKSHQFNWQKNATDKTAQDLGIYVVAHETSKDAYRRIIWSPTGKLNAFISRSGRTGERAVHGDGFYTLRGARGLARGEGGYHIILFVDPSAKEGVDFLIDGDNVIFSNARHLSLFQKSENRNHLENTNSFIDSLLYAKNSYFRRLLINQMHKSREFRDSFWKRLEEQGVQLLANVLKLQDKNIEKTIELMLTEHQDSAFYRTLLKDLAYYLDKLENLEDLARATTVFLQFENPLRNQILKRIKGGEYRYLKVFSKFYSSWSDPLASSPFYKSFVKVLITSTYVSKREDLFEDFENLLNATIKHFSTPELRNLIFDLKSIKSVERSSRFYQAVEKINPPDISGYTSPLEALGKDLPAGQNMAVLEHQLTVFQRANQLIDLLSYPRYYSRIFVSELNEFLDRHQSQILRSPISFEEIKSLLEIFEKMGGEINLANSLVQMGLSLSTSPDDFYNIWSLASELLSIQKQNLILQEFLPKWYTLNANFGETLHLIKFVPSEESTFKIRQEFMSRPNSKYSEILEMANGVSFLDPSIQSQWHQFSSDAIRSALYHLANENLMSSVSEWEFMNRLRNLFQLVSGSKERNSIIRQTWPKFLRLKTSNLQNEREILSYVIDEDLDFEIRIESLRSASKWQLSEFQQLLGGRKYQSAELEEKFLLSALIIYSKAGSGWQSNMRNRKLHDEIHDDLRILTQHIEFHKIIEALDGELNNADTFQILRTIEIVLKHPKTQVTLASAQVEFLKKAILKFLNISSTDGSDRASNISSLFKLIKKESKLIEFTIPYLRKSEYVLSQIAAGNILSGCVGFLRKIGTN